MEVVQASSAVVSKLLHTTQAWTAAAYHSRPLPWPVYQSLPVAGLGVLDTQAALYTLRTSLDTDEGLEAIEAWLQTLQLAQIASDRLLESLSLTHKHLSFWRGQLKAGSHGAFMLLSRGPVGFVRELIAVFHEAEAAWSHHFSQRHTGTAAADGHGWEGAPSDRIEERIIALQLLFTQLAEGLSAVHRGAAALRLCSLKSPSAASNLGQHPDIQKQTVTAIHDTLSGLAAALEQLLPQCDQLQRYDTAARQLQQALRGETPQHASSKHVQQAGSEAVTLQQAQQLLPQVCQLLHVQEGELKHGLRRADAGAALSSATALAARLGPLVPVPAWALMPSALQRHWIKYSIAAAAGVSAAAFLYRHSRFAGSSDLDDWAALAAAAVKGAWADHVVSPLVVVRNELFSTFRDRPSIVSNSEFEADKQSLLRMLAEFQQDHPKATAAGPSNTEQTAPVAAIVASNSNSASVAGDRAVADSDAVNKGMQVIMMCYERDLKSPIRNLMIGELARTLLIQVQRLKLDTEAAMLELDQILRANELSISLVAAIPALLLSWTLLRGMWMLLARRPPDPKKEAMPCRLAMADLERALSTMAAAEPFAADVTAVGTAAETELQDQQQAAAAQGVVLFRLYRVYKEAQMLYRLKDKTSRYSEWPNMQADIMELVQPAVSSGAKLELHSRMTRTYAVLKP